MRNRVQALLARTAEHRCRDSSRRNAHQHHMAQPDAVKRIFESDHALYFVCLDHRDYHITHLQRYPTLVHTLARQVIGERQDGTEIVRRVTPFGRQPGVVVVKPAHHRAYIPGGTDRIELIRSSWYPGTVTRHVCAGHDRPEQPGAGRVTQRQQATADSVHPVVTGSLHCFSGLAHIVIEHIVDDILNHRVEVGTAGVQHSGFAHVFISCYLSCMGVKARFSGPV